MRLLALALGSVLVAGCLDGPAGSDDASAVVDMSSENDVDGSGGGDLAGVYHCAQLNACEQLCKNLMCVAACRQMATASAVTKDVALQNCFNQFCPQQSDMASPICAQDPTTGARSAACTTCINNTLQATTTACSPTTAPECRMCYNPAQDCQND